MAQTETSSSKSGCGCGTKTPFRPLGNRVLLQRFAKEEALKGGIVLPDSAKKQQERARVVAIGPGKREKDGELTPVPVKVGEVVLFEKYAGQEVTIDGEEFTVVRADDLIAVIEGE